MCFLHAPGLLFLTFLVSCKPETIPVDDGEPVQHLMKSNTEEPGTDCHVCSLHLYWRGFFIVTCMSSNSMIY